MVKDKEVEVHRLKDIRLNEVSVVDNPANPNAFIHILKVDDDVMKGKFKEVMQAVELEEKVREMMEPMWEQSSALRQSFVEVMRDTSVKDKGAALKTCVSEFAEALKASVQSAVSSVGKSMYYTTTTDGTSMTTDWDGVKWYYVPQTIVTAGDGGGNEIRKEENKMGNEKTYDQATVDKLIEEAVAKAVGEVKPDPTLVALSEMSDAEKTYFSKLDDKGKEAFISKSKEDRAAVVKESTTKDEVLLVDGQELHKADIGDALFAVIKSQQSKIHEETSKREEAEFAKRAETELPHIPGDAKMKGRFLKHVESIQDEDLKKFATETLKSMNGISKLTNEVGVGGEAVVHENDFDKRAQDIANKEGIDLPHAIDKLMATPEGKKLYEANRKI